MAEFNSLEAVVRSSTGQLAKIMNLDEGTPDAWSEEDVAAMLRHQLAAPLEFDLSSVEMEDAEARRRDKTLTGAAKKRIESFGDLLFHREPPMELLKLAKEFFKKRLKECKEGSPEFNVAYLCYLLSVLAAGTNGPAISALAPGELLKGIEWALQQPWADDKTKCLLSAAAQRLQTAGSPVSHAF